jgi:hypothetical protein
MAEELVQPGEIGIDFIPERRASLASIEIEGEGLVFDEDGGSWHHLNTIAQLIWNCCDGSGTIAEIAVDISDIFGEEPKTVRQSVLETVRQFGQQGLLESVEPNESGHSQHAHGHAPLHDHLGEVQDADGQRKGPEPKFLAVPPSS